MAKVTTAAVPVRRVLKHDWVTSAITVVVYANGADVDESANRGCGSRRQKILGATDRYIDELRPGSPVAHQGRGMKDHIGIFDCRSERLRLSHISEKDFRAGSIKRLRFFAAANKRANLMAARK